MQNSNSFQWKYGSRILRWSMAFGMTLVLCGALHAQRLTWLGTLPGWNWSSEALGVSADGRVVVGRSANASGQSRAFRWENGVMQDLGTLGGESSDATAVSADGSVVVGSAANASGQRRAFRWENGAMQDLGTLGGGWSEAWDVSVDGAVIVVGGSYTASGTYRAFRWENGVMQDLGTLGGWIASQAYGVSADGSVIVGDSHYWWLEYFSRAFRWTASGGMQDLGAPGGTYVYSAAYGVSADGSVRVGAGYLLFGVITVAIRWTPTGEIQILGPGVAYGVSADGSVVVGNVIALYTAYPFRWTQAGGMEDLNQTYASLLTNGSVLHDARGISPDGRYIVGYGYNAATGRDEAYLLDTRCTPRNGDVDGSGCVDDADLLTVLFAFGATGVNPADVNCDGTIDDADLLMVLFNFGSGC